MQINYVPLLPLSEAWKGFCVVMTAVAGSQISEIAHLSVTDKTNLPSGRSAAYLLISGLLTALILVPAEAGIGISGAFHAIISVAWARDRLSLSFQSRRAAEAS